MKQNDFVEYNKLENIGYTLEIFAMKRQLCKSFGFILRKLAMKWQNTYFHYCRNSKVLLLGDHFIQIMSENSKGITIRALLNRICFLL